MRITVDEAKPFFAHVTQLRGAKLNSPDDLPEAGFVYWADGPICGAFHQAPWESVWFAHYGAKPEAWGGLRSPALRVLTGFCGDVGASCILGWTDIENRAAIAFAKRLGFRETGTIDAGRVLQTEWRPEWR